MHDLNDSVQGFVPLFVLSNVLHFLLKEFSEVNSNGEIDKDILVEVQVIISFNRLDGLKLLKVSERASTLEQHLGHASTLESLNHVNNVVDLVAVEHLHEEGVEGVAGVSDQVDNLLVEFLLH